MPTTLKAILARLRSLANPRNVAGMARYGITGEGRLGISAPELYAIAKETGRSHPLALALFDTHIPEAMQVAAMVADPEQLTVEQADKWAAAFNSWDVCDGACQNLFVKSPLAWTLVKRWAGREEEFEKRAAFALIAYLAVHDNTAGDRKFIGALKLVRGAAHDERNYVKKAVNWALRGIGKRNLTLHRAALETARKLRASASRSARWIAADAIRELENPKTRQRIKPSSPSA